MQPATIIRRDRARRFRAISNTYSEDVCDVEFDYRPNEISLNHFTGLLEHLI